MRACALFAAALAALAAGGARAQAAPVPSFAELEAQHAKIGAIRIDARNVFDLDDPRENNAIFRAVNALHVTTRPHVIERVLLFKSGEPVSARLIEETERLLRANLYLYDATIVPAAYHDGVVDIDVVTRDAWTLDITGKVSRSGGTNSTQFGVKDYNLLGTGVQLGFSQKSDVDRRGSELVVGYPQAFDGWTTLSLLRGHYNDGSRYTAAVSRPFYALDTRWAAAASWDDWDRIDSIYNAGDVVSQYRHRWKIGEMSGGWSSGLQHGFAQRFSAGVSMRDDTYAVEPDHVAPPQMPVDHAMRGPFLRHEVVADRYRRLRNRDQIARPEFVEMGFTSRLQLTRSLESWGASRAAWLYSASASRGFTFPWQHDVLASASVQRNLASTGAPMTQAGVLLRYYGPQSPHAALYAAVSADRIGSGGGASDELLIGGDNGLRGYPLRYQSGTRRELFTIEERVYTDWYPFRLARVGAAVFYDRGRAWGGVNPNVVNGGWLSDVGVGLRFAIDRASFGNVLHVDLAAPLNRVPGIKPVQFLVKTQLTF